jgi:Ca2+-binding EF-hand superfamily protein
VFGLAAALVRSVFVELDADSDGVITRAELMDISAQSYRGDDPAAPANLLFGPFGI